MVSRVDVHMYSLASAILRTPQQLLCLAWKHLLRLKTEAPVPKTALYTSLSSQWSGESVDFTGNRTQVYADN